MPFDVNASTLVAAGPDAVRAYGSYADARAKIDTVTSLTSGPMACLGYSASRSTNGLLDVTGTHALVWIAPDIEQLTAVESWQHLINGNAPNYDRPFTPVNTRHRRRAVGVAPRWPTEPGHTRPAQGAHGVFERSVGGSAPPGPARAKASS